MVGKNECERWELVLMMRWDLRLKEDVSEVLYFYGNEHVCIHHFAVLKLFVSSS